ncbi:hypothetical protein HZ326_28518 [Fusarium oxysporum f. sp. albedinis]|nr:hypothetical protein HZ326_28518 [Fusarium oxysporum f. sp. albedinis]
MGFGRDRELLQSRLRRVFPKPTLPVDDPLRPLSLLIVVFPKIDICIWSVRYSSRRSNSSNPSLTPPTRVSTRLHDKCRETTQIWIAGMQLRPDEEKRPLFPTVRKKKRFFLSQTMRFSRRRRNEKEEEETADGSGNGFRSGRFVRLFA